MRWVVRAAVLVLLVLASCVALPAQGWNQVEAHPDVLVVVIDTGADALHPEFGGYLGQPGVTDPQIVAWWDFGLDGIPAPGQTWDATHPVPFDPVGHGTGTASLVGGSTLGTCPGVKLAIAKVADAQGALTGDIGAAIRWASVTLGADVISMSFGSTIASVAALDTMDERVDEAWRLGTLPVGSVGNGAGNLGAKVPNELHAPSYDPHVLAVGASDKAGSRLGTLVDGYYSNLDPDLIAWGTDVPMASPGGGYVSESGTSFSTPKVAGYAACLMQAAHDAGKDASPGRIGQLLEWTARDDAALPAAVDGFGFVDGATYDAALGFARSGLLPHGPQGVANPAQSIAQHAGRTVLTSAEPSAALVNAPDGRASTVRGPSVPGGTQRAALYHVHAASRQVLTLDLAYTARPSNLFAQDLDLYALQPGADDDALVSMDEVLADSINAPSASVSHEGIAFAAGLTGDYVVLVLAYTLQADQPFALTATLDGQAAQADFLGEVLAVGAFEQV
ncbi:MAG: S8 family serine peptidase [Halobacteriales archaeon]|nr:S8 family serine peptidase [Halobacteriales archaeon]